MIWLPRYLTIACISSLTLLGPLQREGQAQNPASTDAAACWTPEALAGKPDEKAIHRVPYDASIEPAGEAVSLPPLPGDMRGSIRRVKLQHGEKFVALTFDLCENADEISGYDFEIFDTLRRLGVKATFFPSGKWLLDHRERAEQLLASPLFQVGAHSWTHRNFRLLKEDQVKADLALDLKADARVREALHARACYRVDSSKSDAAQAAVFRFPFGTCSAESLNAVNDAGLLVI